MIVLSTSPLLSQETVSAKRLNQQGMSLLGSGNYKAAITKFTQSINIDESSSGPFRHRATCKMNLEDYRGAIRDYTKAIEIYEDKLKNQISIHNGYRCFSFGYRSFCKMKIKDYEGSIADCNKMVTCGDKAYQAKNPAKAANAISKIKLGEINEGCIELSLLGEEGYEPAYTYILQYCN